MYFLPLLLACQDSLRAPGGAQYHDTSVQVKEDTVQGEETEGSELGHGDREVSLSLYEREVMSLVNDHREHEDLEDLHVHDVLVEIARNHSMEMALGVLPLGHDGFDERTEEALDYFEHSTYEIAENVGMARGNDASQVAVDMWLESTGHRDNIEGPYTLSGIGTYERDGVIYFTQLFLGID